LWVVGPSGDVAAELVNFWRGRDAAGDYRTFERADGDTRFLGDLYQDLSEEARKRYALLQTPEFVEEFILDRALEPACAEFGFQNVRLIDPTCGSGHFLLGAFRRLLARWERHYRELTGRDYNPIDAAGRVLGQVYGVDVNPYAVAVARIRLLIASVQACGLVRLKGAPGWHVNVCCGDSLYHGRRWRVASNEPRPHQPSLGGWDELYHLEDVEAVNRVLSQKYHAVVGNPPYITVKDAALNKEYRKRYDTCHQKYSLGVPFTERFWDLCRAAADAGPAGFVGMITANSFMKREFGKKLIETFFPKIDLTHVIDTSGAHIPGVNADRIP
jgi:type I restriction-modification system DNA methylase subunit